MLLDIGVVQGFQEFEGVGVCLKRVERPSLSLPTLNQWYSHQMVCVVEYEARKWSLVEKRHEDIDILLTSTGCVCNNKPYRLSTPRPMAGTKSGANGSSWFTCPRPDLGNIMIAYSRRAEKSKGHAYMYEFLTSQRGRPTQ